MPLPKHSATKPPARLPLIGEFTAVAGRRVHLLRSGEGPRVLLLHGNGSLGEEILSACRPLPGFAWIAPDRPGFGLSEALPRGEEDPLNQANWLVGLLDTLAIDRIHVVAHSLASGSALCLASQHAHRVRSVTLVSPFCRPTPHRWMPGLRLAVAPVLGGMVRAVLPALARHLRKPLLRRLTAPNAVPVTMRSLPLAHAARPRAVITTAAELRSFNAGMKRADPRIGPAVPVIALFGARDRTAAPGWHLPWLQGRVARLDVRIVPDAGHMLHHVVPPVVWSAIQAQTARPATAKLRAATRGLVSVRPGTLGTVRG